MLGIGLYLGEGSKVFETVTISNSDPKVIKLAIAWLYKACGVRKRNLHLRVHLYPDNNVENVLAFWSGETQIPLSQFGKTIIDIRKNKLKQNRRKLPYGTVHLKIRSGGVKDLGIYLHRKIMAWIDNCFKQARI